ncbi:MAG: zinc ribbon domain-containing protein [Lachnospira sp.]|nr:zinc ribbon domain-containing protein [Lachnospira sp.]
MEIKKCPECGAEVEGKTCSNCGYSFKKKYRKKIIIVLAVLVLLVGGGSLGYVKYQQYTKEQEKIAAEKAKEAEEEKKAKIDELLKKVEELYKDQNFDQVSNIYDELEKLGYELGSKRDTLEYDKTVAKDIAEFHSTLKKVDSNLESGSYLSIREELDKLKKPMKTIKNLETNPYSKLSNYALNIRSNLMFDLLYDQYVYSAETNVDHGLVQNGYAMIVTTYTDELLKIDCPID